MRQSTPTSSLVLQGVQQHLGQRGEKGLGTLEGYQGQKEGLGVMGVRQKQGKQRRKSLSPFQGGHPYTTTWSRRNLPCLHPSVKTQWISATCTRREHGSSPALTVTR